MSHFIYEKEKVACGRKEKQAKGTGENLSLEKRKKEKMPARRKNLTEMKDNSQDRFRWHTRIQCLFSGSVKSLAFRLCCKISSAGLINGMAIGF